MTSIAFGHRRAEVHRERKRLTVARWMHERGLEQECGDQPSEGTDHVPVGVARARDPAIFPSRLELGRGIEQMPLAVHAPTAARSGLAVSG